MASKPGRKWGQIRGEYVEVRELATVLRDVADGHGLTLRDLETRMPYGHTVISENLNGEKRPAWKFVAAFLDACAGHDQHARALLQSRVRPLWDAASPGRATRITTVPQPSGELIPTDLHAWVTTLRKTAVAQQAVASLQLSVSRHLALVNGLMTMLARLNEAARALTDERDALREELRTHVGAVDELVQTRMLLEETQRRLDAAEQLQAETSRRLDDALRQREKAERLKHAAFIQLEAARQRLAGLEQHSVSFIDHSSEEQESDSSDRSLMGATDQAVTAEILRHVDNTLDEEAENLSHLQSEVAGASPDNVLLSAGQSTRSADNQAKIRRREERYRSLVQGGSQVVWVTGPDGAMIKDSPEWRWITGQSQRQFLRQGWLDSVHPEDRERVERDWHDCVRTEKVFDDRYRIRTRSGSYRHYDVRAVPIERDGGIVVWVVASTDATSQREAEEMRGRLTEQLSAAALRTARLQQATSMLAEALAVEQVVEVITEVGRTAIGALRSAVALLESDGTRLKVVNGDGLPSAPDAATGPLTLRSPSVMTRAIATLRPVLIEDPEDLRRQFEGELEIDPATVMATSDERSWVGLPLGTASAPLGALRFSFGRPRKITVEERVFLEALAGQCSLAIERAALYEREHTTAMVLQRSLLPDRLPRVYGSLAAQYRPPRRRAEIGGDWYDAFILPDGRLAMAVGDVMGKGLPAVANMGMVRNAIRTLALTDPFPEKVLTGLDRLFSSTERAEQFTTIVYAMVEPRAGVVYFGNAGHPPPLVLPSKGRPRFVTTDDATTCLGLENPRWQRTVDIPRGSTVILYSDGLITDRLRSIDTGLNTLIEVAAQARRRHAGDLEELLNYILDAMITGREQRDDVAAIAYRNPDHRLH